MRTKAASGRRDSPAGLRLRLLLRSSRPSSERRRGTPSRLTEQSGRGTAIFSSKSGENIMYRQGDVLIIPVKFIPANATEPVERESGRVILAHGEATGHAHAIKAEGAALFRDPKLMTIFMKVSGDAVALEHDEHKTITIPSGNYRVIRQREYSPSEIRNV